MSVEQLQCLIAQHNTSTTKWTRHAKQLYATRTRSSESVFKRPQLL